MIYFRSDYSQGAHPKVMEALMKTNMEHTDGYGLDAHCEHASQMIRELIGIEDCEVHMMVGGQVFPILPAEVVRELEKDFFFYEWAPEKDGMIPIRLVTAWGTEKADIREFLEKTRKIMKIMV